MANAKISSMIDQAARIQRAERRADRDAMLALVEDEINQLRQIIAVLSMRLENMEAGVPELNAGQETGKAS